MRGWPLWRAISPCVRKNGGSPTLRWRSELSVFTSCFKSSPRRCSAALYSEPANSAGSRIETEGRGPLAAAGAAAGAASPTIGAAAVTDGRGGRGAGLAAGAAGAAGVSSITGIAAWLRRVGPAVTIAVS